MAAVGDEFFENLTLEKIDQLIDRLQ